MSKQILVIGDSHEFIQKLKDAYRTSEMMIANASDCQIGLELVYNTRYDLVILIEEMLKKSVYDIAYKLNLSQRNTQIIVIANEITSDSILLANELGIYDVHRKEGDFKELILSIDKAIHL